MVKIIIAGGGTGGHLFPGIALAEELKKRDKSTKIFFVGTKRGIESRELPELGFDLLRISIMGLQRKASLKNLLFIFSLIKSFFQSLVLLSRIKPGVVIGTGGYVSYPVLLSAHLKRIPTLIQEQNSHPGIATRLLAGRASKICLSYDASLAYFSRLKDKGDKLKVLGNPIRKEITQADRKSGLTEFHLAGEGKVVFILGGSQGAHRINLAMLETMELLRDDIELLWQTGEKDFSYVKEKTRDKKINLSLHAFINEMGLAYAAADLVVSRAGALTLAEITACGKPAVLIPYPFAADDHQRFNAQELERKGAAKMILEGQLDGKELASFINQLLSDESKLAEMSRQSRDMAKLDAASKIADEVENLLKK